MAKIAIFTSAEGHLSIAQAIESSLEKHHSVSVFFDRNSFYNVYTPIYQLIPSAYQIPYKLTQQPGTKNIIQEMFKLHYGNKITAFYDEQQPDLTISTYFMFNPTLSDFNAEKKKPFINIISDPRTIHPLIVAEKATYNLSFDQSSNELCQSYCKDQSNCIPSGWFVKPDFEKKYNQADVRRQLGLDPSLFTLLISSGSEGTTMVMKLLPFLVQLDKPIQVVIACGSNKTLLKSVNGFTSILKKIRANTSIVALSFVTNMHQYMQAADLVVGKAGPNSLFESVATETPFFAITHIAGQEDGNLDIIKEHNLGYVEENPFKAQTILSSILDNPDQLKTFAPSLKKMAAYNKKSKETLLQLIDEQLA